MGFLQLATLQVKFLLYIYIASLLHPCNEEINSYFRQQNLQDGPWITNLNIGHLKHTHTHTHTYTHPHTHTHTHTHSNVDYFN